MENYSINISGKINSIIPIETVEISNFHFSHYKSMETISCHSNQSSYPTEIKKHNFCREQCPMQVCQVSASSSFRFLKRRILNIFLKIYHLCCPVNQSNQAIWKKTYMKHNGLLNKHFCEKKVQISPMTWQKLSISTFPIIRLWKL